MPSPTLLHDAAGRPRRRLRSPGRSGQPRRAQPPRGQGRTRLTRRGRLFLVGLPVVAVLAVLAAGVAPSPAPPDTTPPTLTVETGDEPADPTARFTLRIASSEAVEVTVDGQPARVRPGAYTRAYRHPPSRPVVVRAIDPAGNTAEEVVNVDLELPGDPGAPPLRAVHVGEGAWNDPALRTAVMDLIDEGAVTAVQLDIKDEEGRIGYASGVGLVAQMGALRPPAERIDLADVVDTLHARGVRVIGRIVNFADPVLVQWAVAEERLDLVVQDAEGLPLGSYGGYANFAHPLVRDYNIDLAEEAALAGVDDILLDYVRRPEGRLDQMTFPGLDGTPTDALVGFLSETQARLAPLEARLGASVFGSSINFPEGVAQDIGRFSEHVDYLSPMLYPSHWAAGDFGLPDPNRAPYETIHAALPDWTVAAEAAGIEVVPWLQDFSLYGVVYGPDEVRAQIDAAADRGVDDFLLWNARSRYTAAALTAAAED